MGTTTWQPSPRKVSEKLPSLYVCPCVVPSHNDSWLVWVANWTLEFTVCDFQRESIKHAFFTLLFLGILSGESQLLYQDTQEVYLHVCLVKNSNVQHWLAIWVSECPWDPGSSSCSPVNPQMTVAPDDMWNLWKNLSQNHPAKPLLYSWPTELCEIVNLIVLSSKVFISIASRNFIHWLRDGEGRACALKTPSPQREGSNESFLNSSIADLQSCASFRCIAKWFSYMYVCVCIFIYVCVCVCVYVPAKSLSHVQLFETPWTIGCQVPLSMRFCRQEYRSGLPCPPPEDLPDPGIKLKSPVASALQADSLLLSYLGSPYMYIQINFPYRLFQNI